MSLAKLEEIRCPCGNVFEAELWNAINAAEDPDLKEALKCGEINVVYCPVCGQMIYAEHFVLYHDTENELLAFVYPASFSAQATHWAQKMKADFEAARRDMAPEERLGYGPLLLFGLDALVALIIEEEEENDEVMILKYAAKDLELSVVDLSPSAARARCLPRLLPRRALPGGDHRAEIIAGLRRLLEYNEHLTRYRKLLSTIERDTNWSFPGEPLKKKTHR